PRRGRHRVRYRLLALPVPAGGLLGGGPGALPGRAPGPPRIDPGAGVERREQRVLRARRDLAVPRALPGQPGPARLAPGRERHGRPGPRGAVPAGPLWCEQLCCGQRAGGSRLTRPQAGSMAQEEKNLRFSERVREQLLLQRVLVLDGPLDDDNGTLLTTQLLMLAGDDPGADIALWINSPGGSVPSMLAIRDVMRLVPC